MNISALVTSRSGSKNPAREAEEAASRLQEYFESAGLAGEVIPVGAFDGARARSIREAADSARYDTIFLYPADGSIPPKEIELLTPWIERGFAVVVGSRFGAKALTQKRAPLGWIWKERLRAAWAGFRAGGLTDGGSGFAVLSREKFRKLAEEGAGDRDWLFRARKHGWNVKEVGVMWIAEKPR